MSWTFTQLGGPKKTLTLDGYAAPFGRPRQQPVAKELIKASIQTTVYPGSNGPPTRIGFGTRWEPMQINGRWMTRYLPANQNALTVADDWTEFVRNVQPCRIAWGNIVVYQGMIEELELSRESPDEIAWRMSLLVDQRDDIGTQIEIRDATVVNQDMSDLQAFVLASNVLVAPALPDMAPDFFDALNFAIGNLKAFTGSLVALADAFNNIEKATFSTIQSFRGILTNVESALAEMRATVLTTEIDSAIAVRRAETDIAFYRYQFDFDINSLNAFAALRAVDRKVELSARANPASFIEAKDGDTWEKLATRATGTPNNAGPIREANGIQFGDLPQSGSTYLVP